MRTNRSRTLFFTLMAALLSLALSMPNYAEDQKPKLECTITSYAKIYYVTTENSHPNKRQYKSSTCPTAINQKFSKLLLNYAGRVKGSYLANVNPSMFLPYKIIVEPKWITITPIKELINSSSALAAPWFLSSISMIGSNNQITSDHELQFNFNCINCDQPGNRSLKMVVNNPNNGHKNINWLSVVVGKKTSALIATRDLGVTNQRLAASSFKIATVTTTTSRSYNYFLDQERLRFYKLNKPLSTNQPLKRTDLIPIPLIQMGDMVKTVFKKNGLTLRGVARATQRGEQGDLIQLSSISGKQRLIGKVIDYKQVEVQL
ncbi:MAG: flagellar basal body P-ring formation protein FlgA [Bdellovibrionales bacterium]|nr:flagellar basal body P-ring formation protein FlgA [Bdellovibrionales bacterium]MBT3525566.1 flagellar basal body P-ring formation protein FlgA [Bdellovibrionales bacterium]MBT7670268.1 flagellar basal body P-ring formation protein FlgA [Bdellovibrionales bacterium]